MSVNVTVVTYSSNGNRSNNCGVQMVVVVAMMVVILQKSVNVTAVTYESRWKWYR